MKYTCMNCGSSSHDATDLCNPTNDSVEAKFCATSTDKVCEEKVPAMHFTCDSCGGMSPDAAHLCNPREL